MVDPVVNRMQITLRTALHSALRSASENVSNICSQICDYAEIAASPDIEPETLAWYEDQLERLDVLFRELLVEEDIARDMLAECDEDDECDEYDEYDEYDNQI